MRDRDELLAIGDRVVDRARPGEQVEAVVVHDRETEVRAFDGEIEALSSAESQGVGIRVVRDQRQGFAYAGSLDPGVIDETLTEARDNAAFGTVDEHIGLAEPDGVETAALDLWRDGLESVAPERKVDLALELEREVVAADPRVRGVESAEYSDVMAVGAIVTSTGIRVASRETACALMAFSLAEEGDETQTGFGWSIGRHPDDLSVPEAATDAAERATRLLGAGKPPSDRLTVVFDPWVTAQFLAVVASTLSGEAVLKGRSPFADRVDEQIASPLVELVDDPTDERAFTATEVDGEGLATRRNPLIEGGVLRQFVHNSYTARRAKVASTASAVRGFKSTPGVGCRATTLRPGDRAPEALLAEIDKGVLVQEVSGLHSGVNPISGDFSTGASGLRITDGAAAEPLREFTIASTIQRMLQDVVAVGSDLEWLPMSSAGVTLVIDDVTVSGE